MTKNNVVSVDFTALQSAINKMRNAKESLSNLSLRMMNSYDKLNVDNQINDALDKLIMSIDEIKELLNTTQLSKLTSQLIGVDKTGNYISGMVTKSSGIAETEREKALSMREKNKKKNSSTNSYVSSSVTSIVVTSSTVSSSTNKTNAKTKDKKKVKKLSKKAANTYKDKIHKALGKGDMKAVKKYYSKLVAIIGVKSTNKFFKNLGYTVTSKNGKITSISSIEKIKSNKVINKTNKKPTNSTESTVKPEKQEPLQESTLDIRPDTPEKPDDKNSNEVVAVETPNDKEPNNSIKTESTIPENNASNINKTDNSNTVVNNNNNNTSSKNNQQNNVSYSQNSDISGDYKGDDIGSEIVNDVTTNDSLNDDVSSGKIPEVEADNKVISITDDTPTVSTKKSSGIGTAVPLGLGTIAAGAAAVAGVRYIKNRHDSQEEYDKSYDDENNNFESENEYEDSAQYDDGQNYMSDDYLGPSGSTYEEDNSSDYVDPEDLELDETDIVLDEFN